MKCFLSIQETIEVSDDDYEDAPENFALEEEIFSESSSRNQLPLSKGSFVLILAAT